MAPQRLARYLLPVGTFLALLYLCSLRLHVPLLACVQGGAPCPWWWWGEAVPPHQPGTQPPPEPTAALCKGQRFQMGRLLHAFQATLGPHGEILLDPYLAGWAELGRFMESLGPAFGLVLHETRAKLAVLQDLRDGPSAPHYTTAQAMATHELAQGLVVLTPPAPPGNPPSGCRTLLRLHRALLWLQLFVGGLGEGGDPARVCARAYHRALAPHHPWWVRQAAAVAFLALPPRRELLAALCLGDPGVRGAAQAQAELRRAAVTIARVYNRTQDLFTTHGMLGLP